MSDYIKRDYAFAVLSEYYNLKTYEQHRALREVLGRVPPADVRPVYHARWGWNKTKGEWYCTNCFGPRFYDLTLGMDASYCGRCGAKMDG